MQAKVPPATCFPHNRNAKRILQHTDAHRHAGGKEERKKKKTFLRFFTDRKIWLCLFFFLTRQRKVWVPCVSHEMSNIVQQCHISSPVVAVVGSWLFVGLGSFQCNCFYSLLYPEAWQHIPLLTSIIWL